MVKKRKAILGEEEEERWEDAEEGVVARWKRRRSSSSSGIEMGGRGWGWRVGAKRKKRIGRERRREKERMKGVENIEEGIVKKGGRRRGELGGKGGCLMQLCSESGIVKRLEEMGEEAEETLKG